MNKREEQRRNREQRIREAEARTQRNKMITKALLFIGLPLLVGVVIFALIQQGRTYSPSEISENDHVRGNPGGVVLMMYADFQCAACATEHRLIAQAWNSIRDRAQLVFRQYPLSNVHAHAWTAALYSEAAGRQGRFWEMYDQLFINQAYWSTLDSVSEEFDGYLTDLGLDVAQAHQDMESDDLLQKVRNDQRGGTQAGVRGTPTLFVNGRLVQTPRTTTELVNLVNQAAAQDSSAD